MIRNTLLDFIHSTKSLISRKSQKPPILFLPDCLLQKIYDNLHLVDKACLSLSCKTFFALFSMIIEHEEFSFPRLLKINDPRQCINRKDVLRNQLLLRLETKNWLYCGACLKLHPRKHFKTLNDQPLQRRCREHAGVVDICPCISLTGADRKHIIRLLTDSNTSSGTFGQFDTVWDGEGTWLKHKCCYGISKHWMTILSLIVYIDDDGRLVVCTHYELYTLTMPRVNRRAEPVFACPHTDLTMWAGWFQSSTKCKHCETSFDGTSRPNLSPARFEVMRVLGSDKGLESTAWFRQSRFTNETFEEYLAFWRDSAAIRDHLRKEYKKRRARLRRCLESECSGTTLSRARSA